MRTEEEIKSLKSVKEKLKECKNEWLEKNPKGQPALGVSTVQQILDYATDCVTTWNFSVEEQWREEVMKLPKGASQWVFDGYVYHVRGTLHIEGLGSRTQYGSKIAIGGKDNQNSSYKSAASDCLKKCASLFGVGSSIYSKIKVETEEDQWQQQNQQNASIAYNQQQTQQQQQTTLPNGDIQQGEYIWSQQQQNWIHQTQYLVQNGGQYPSAGLTEQQRVDWSQEVMRQYDPKAYNHMQQQQQYQQPQVDPIQQIVAEADQAVASGAIDFPFENVPAKQETVQQDFQAQPQAEAQPQASATQQNFQAVENVAPVGAPVQEPKQEKDPLAHIEANNPWNTPENQAEIQVFAGHKQRLSIGNDSELLPHVREYFKDGSATIASVTPETLKGFNAYLQNIQV